MKAEMLGAVRERERESYTLENKSAVCLGSRNLINQNNKYRSILYLCNFAMQK